MFHLLNTIKNLKLYGAILEHQLYLETTRERDTMKLTTLLPILCLFPLLAYCHEVVKDQYWNGINEYLQKLPEIPHAGSPDPRVNIAKLGKLRGTDYLHDLMVESGLGVYRLKLFDDRVILADPVAIQAIYDTKLTEKSKDFGLVNVNTNSLRGYLPTSNTNGRDKAIKKRGMWKILQRAQRNKGYQGLYEILKKHTSEVLSTVKGDRTDIEPLLDLIKVRTITEYFFDKAFDLSLEVSSAWFAQSFTPKNKPDAKLTEKAKGLNKLMYDYIDRTPWGKYTIRSKQYRRGDRRSLETLKSEALFFAIVFSAFPFSFSNGALSLRSGLASSIPLFVGLNNATRATLLKEVDRFNQNDGKSMKEKLGDFHAMDRFVLEVYRLFPPLTQVFARARTNFILDSLQGRYFIKKGTYFIGYSYGAQRDPDTFRFPNEFTMTGDEEHTKNNFFTFSGLFYQKPTFSNRKCLGQYLEMNLLKMFLSIVSKCEIELVSSPAQILVKKERVLVKKFKCPK